MSSSIFRYLFFKNPTKKSCDYNLDNNISAKKPLSRKIYIPIKKFIKDNRKNFDGIIAQIDRKADVA